MATFSRADKRRQVQAVLDEMGAAVEHLPRPMLVKVLPALRQAHHELEADTRRWLAGAQGRTRFTTQRYRSALVAVRQSITKAQRRLGPALTDGMWTGAERAGRLATEHLLTELETFGRIFEGTIQPVALETAAIIAKGDKVLWKRFETSKARYSRSIGRALVQELAVSRIRTETMDELATRLQRRLPQIFAADRHGALRLARTETMAAYNTYHWEGLRDAAAEDVGLLARWDSTWDFRRCPMCRSLDGQVRDPTKKDDRFLADWWTKPGKRSKRRGPVHHQLLIARPPGHPNCRCVVTPWREEWGEVKRSPARAQPEIQAQNVA